MEDGRLAEPLVLHVIPSPVARGAQREARALADRLDAPGVRRHRILALVTAHDEASDDSVAVDYTLDERTTATTVGFDPRLVRKLRHAVERLDPVLIVAHGGEPLKFLVPALIGRRRPLAYYAIGTVAEPARRRSRRWLWRYLVRRPDLVTAEGSEVLEECRTFLGVPSQRLVLVPNGRDPEEFKPTVGGPVRTPPVITFVGALTVQKRPDRFVELAVALRDRGVAFRALLVGDGPLRPEVTSMAGAAGVELLGARGDIAEVLRETDVFVFPSLPRGEGMPGVLIEAGLSGVPVVASRVPGVAAIIADGETGIVVDPDDFDSLVAAVAALLADPSGRRIMGEAARRRCSERFSLDVVASAWRDALVPLLAR